MDHAILIIEVPGPINLGILLFRPASETKHCQRPLFITNKEALASFNIPERITAVGVIAGPLRRITVRPHEFAGVIKSRLDEIQILGSGGAYEHVIRVAHARIPLRRRAPFHPNRYAAPMASEHPTRNEHFGKYLALGIGTHVMWGFFPLYFHLLEPAGSLEIIVHRALWAFIACLIALALTRSLPRMWRVIRTPALMAPLAAAGFLVVINWTTYIYAILIGHTTDAALGYYINPLFTVALGMVVLHERISRLQGVALGLGILAVIVIIVGLGRLPWISLALPASFGLYSLVKKKVALKVAPLDGMAIETAVVIPILGIYYAYLVAHQSTSFHTLQRAGDSAMSWQLHLAMLIGAGILTVIPLITFAKASQGLPLGLLGFLQYLSPSIQLIIGVCIFHEYMEPTRWIATGIVWVALALLSVDGVIRMRRARQ